MSDIRLDSSGDVDVSSGGLSLTKDSVDALEQSLAIRLKGIKGEWRFNEEDGVDYLGLVFVKGTSQGIVDSVFRERIISTTGVASIVDFQSTFDKSTREYKLDFKVKKDDGIILSTTFAEVI